MAFVTDLYRITETFPKHELYGLTSQLRRAAVSIPSNIAEGQGRSFDKEFSKFLSNAMGSLMEVETQLQIAANLGYIRPQQTAKCLKEAAEIGRVLNGLIASVRRDTEFSK